MSNGDDIAAEVLAALQEAGEATGDGPLLCTLRRPADRSGLTPAQAEAASEEAPTDYQVTAVQGTKNIRDAAGALTGQTRTMLTIDATGEAPRKSDLIAVGVAPADVGADTVFVEIADIETLAPGGTALLYEVMLAD